MNDRFLEIAKQAGIATGHITAMASDAQTIKIEKFAEFIIRQCLNEIESHYGEGREIPLEGGGHYHSDDWDDAIRCVASSIRERFEIEPKSFWDMMMLMMPASRVEVIDERGRSYVKYGVTDIKFSRQDDDKTLKIFLQVNQYEPSNQ